MDLKPRQVLLAHEMWDEGRTLGEIANAVNCSVYDLSPMLYWQEIRQVFKDARNGSIVRCPTCGQYSSADEGHNHDNVHTERPSERYSDAEHT